MSFLPGANGKIWLNPLYRSNIVHQMAKRGADRGHAPLWLRQLELQGHSREEFSVTEG